MKVFVALFLSALSISSTVLAGSNSPTVSDDCHSKIVFSEGFRDGFSKFNNLMANKQQNGPYTEEDDAVYMAARALSTAARKASPQSSSQLSPSDINLMNTFCALAAPGPGVIPSPGYVHWHTTYTILKDGYINGLVAASVTK